MLIIDDIRELCTDENIIISRHAIDKMKERDINRKEIFQSIFNGEIIEQYPTDYPYPSCLISGISVNEKQIHIVAGLGENKLWIITVYYPGQEKWENGYKIRKVGK